MIKLSVIIPVAPGERLNELLEKQLASFPDDWEILLCSPERPSIKASLESRAQWVQSRIGRAHCLNAGAEHAVGEYLWFLHADSILLDNTADRIRQTMQKDEKALYYFDLKFFARRGRLMRLNEIGVLLRCRFLKTPFGDQAFLIKNELFKKLPVYSEEAEYGEDHLLVRDYRRHLVPIKPIGMEILTSARKYEEFGWLRTTMNHLTLWRRQAKQDTKNNRRNRHEIRNHQRLFLL